MSQDLTTSGSEFHLVFRGKGIPTNDTSAFLPKLDRIQQLGIRVNAIEQGLERHRRRQAAAERAWAEGLPAEGADMMRALFNLFPTTMEPMPKFKEEECYLWGFEGPESARGNSPKEALARLHALQDCLIERPFSLPQPLWQVYCDVEAWVLDMESMLEQSHDYATKLGWD